jgi:hypothetical protein
MAMNDKDKEAFNKWLNDQDYKYDTWDGQDYRDGKIVSIYSETELAWQAACEYKDKEYSNIMDAMTQTSQNNAKLVDENIQLKKKAQMNIHNSAFNGLLNENKKLREALEYIQANTDSSYIFNWAEEALKDVVKNE